MTGSPLWIVLTITVFLSGCSIHPLPEDVTADTTITIIQKIRCEAREALDEISQYVLRKYGDHHTIKVADKILNNEITVYEAFDNPIYRSKIHPSAAYFFQVLTLTGVALDFDFTMNSGDNGMADLNFRLPFTTGEFTLGLKAGKNLNRENKRTIELRSTFYELHNEEFYYLRGTKVPVHDCREIAARTAHFVYPITGRIGLFEVFRTFVDLYDQPALRPGSHTEKLTFTTDLTASATPKITLAPISASRFRLSEATGTFTGTRKDEHQVQIVLTAGEAITSAVEARRISRETARKENSRIASLILRRRRVEDLVVDIQNNTDTINALQSR